MVLADLQDWKIASSKMKTIVMLTPYFKIQTAGWFRFYKLIQIQLVLLKFET